ncbi:HugZ family protein [Cribrihabitans neustonicus]|uniref:HugZ family pyridoxamine 5'-phosphate oxidase n=1 Tax=Cribrihabitans neustonicus TaxID=1429085 RepID=UPI003B5A375C
MPSPIRPTDDDARRLARALMEDARFAALGVLDADGSPLVTRVAFALDAEGAPLSLVSDLAAHTPALRRTPACSLLVGEPGKKGDPLTYPRLSLMCNAAFCAHGSAAHGALAAHYLAGHPRAKLYLQFSDFSFVRFHVKSALLNGGFGKAFRLTAADLGLTPQD